MSQALRTGNVRKLKKALQEAPPPSVRPAVPPEPAVEVERLPASEPVSTDHWAALEKLLAEARETGLNGPLIAAREHLEALVAALPAALASEEPEEEPIVLPPFRLPWALAVDPPRSEAQGLDVARALGLDLASARMVARLDHPKVALRSRDRMDLLSRADAWDRELGLAAGVVSADQLLALGPASLILEMNRESDWRVLPGRGWRSEPNELGTVGQVLPPPELQLVVPGEIAIRRYRSVGGELLLKGERRVSVADLHGPGLFLRAVEGLTNFQGWPGLGGLSAVQDFRAFLELVTGSWDVLLPGPRRCAPVRPPRVGEDGRGQSTGWAEWEEHSRICRVLLC